MQFFRTTFNHFQQTNLPQAQIDTKIIRHLAGAFVVQNSGQTLKNVFDSFLSGNSRNSLINSSVFSLSLLYKRIHWKKLSV